MEKFPQIAQSAPLTPPVDLKARVVYFPVRHHSPACAWHAQRLIREMRPDAVLIEGPRNATHLIPFLLHEKTRLPVAIYTTFVQRSGQEIPLRHAAYYPLCEYSPEYVALRAAAEVGAKARFIDLSFPEVVMAQKRDVSDHPDSLLAEHHFRHSRYLREVCLKTGARDPDDLWDHLYELDYEQLEPEDFIRNVLTYCAVARSEYSQETLEAEGSLARERAMAAAIAEEEGRTLVITGGFHTVALPATQPVKQSPLDVAQGDALVALMRYGFEQTDRLNGYASGMPSPEFYQRRWDGDDSTRLMTELGRLAREEKREISTADEIAALHHAQRLAELRGHARMSREDFLDGVRSTFIKGAVDAEGVVILALARKFLAGDRIGDLPPEAGQPPLVNDFRVTAEHLGIDLRSLAARTVTLDLYRKVRDRDISRFFHRLRFLGIEFGRFMRGPDFVRGTDLIRIQEVWQYWWAPQHEARLIERALYGSSLEEASTALLLEQFHKAEQEGQGRRADVATALLLEGCRMGLHRHTQDLLNRAADIASEDASFPSLVGALEIVVSLMISLEPLEAHHIAGLPEFGESLYQRACFLIPALGSTPEEEIESVLDALNGLQQAVTTLGNLTAPQSLHWVRLAELASNVASHAALQGAACGLLFGDGQLPEADLVRQLTGRLRGAFLGAAHGAEFLRGLLRTARSALWLVPEIIARVHEILGEWDEATFLRQLPTLRLALADLTPRECDRVAQMVASHADARGFAITPEADFTEAHLYRALEIEQRTARTLKEDGLEAFGE